MDRYDEDARDMIQEIKTRESKIQEVVEGLRDMADSYEEFAQEISDAKALYQYGYAKGKADGVRLAVDVVVEVVEAIKRRLK